jgi:hypothetical protein
MKTGSGKDRKRESAKSEKAEEGVTELAARMQRELTLQEGPKPFEVLYKIFTSLALPLSSPYLPLTPTVVARAAKRKNSRLSVPLYKAFSPSGTPQDFESIVPTIQSTPVMQALASTLPEICQTIATCLASPREELRLLGYLAFLLVEQAWGQAIYSFDDPVATQDKDQEQFEALRTVTVTQIYVMMGDFFKSSQVMPDIETWDQLPGKEKQRIGTLVERILFTLQIIDYKAEIAPNQIVSRRKALQAITPWAEKTGVVLPMSFLTLHSMDQTVERNLTAMVSESTARFNSIKETLSSVVTPENMLSVQQQLLRLRAEIACKKSELTSIVKAGGLDTAVHNGIVQLIGALECSLQLLSLQYQLQLDNVEPSQMDMYIGTDAEDSARKAEESFAQQQVLITEPAKHALEELRVRAHSLSTLAQMTNLKDFIAEQSARRAQAYASYEAAEMERCKIPEGACSRLLAELRETEAKWKKVPTWLLKNSQFTVGQSMVEFLQQYNPTLLAVAERTGVSQAQDKISVIHKAGALSTRIQLKDAEMFIAAMEQAYHEAKKVAASHLVHSYTHYLSEIAVELSRLSHVLETRGAKSDKEQVAAWKNEFEAWIQQPITKDTDVKALKQQIEAWRAPLKQMLANNAKTKMMPLDKIPATSPISYFSALHTTLDRWRLPMGRAFSTVVGTKAMDAMLRSHRMHITALHNKVLNDQSCDRAEIMAALDSPLVQRIEKYYPENFRFIKQFLSYEDLLYRRIGLLPILLVEAAQHLERLAADVHDTYKAQVAAGSVSEAMEMMAAILANASLDLQFYDHMGDAHQQIIHDVFLRLNYALRCLSMRTDIHESFRGADTEARQEAYHLVARGCNKVGSVSETVFLMAEFVSLHTKEQAKKLDARCITIAKQCESLEVAVMVTHSYQRCRDLLEKFIQWHVQDTAEVHGIGVDSSYEIDVIYKNLNLVPPSPARDECIALLRQVLMLFEDSAEVTFCALEQEAYAPTISALRLIAQGSPVDMFASLQNSAREALAKYEVIKQALTNSLARPHQLAAKIHGEGKTWIEQAVASWNHEIKVAAERQELTLEKLSAAESAGNCVLQGALKLALAALKETDARLVEAEKCVDWGAKKVDYRSEQLRQAMTESRKQIAGVTNVYQYIHDGEGAEILSLDGVEGVKKILREAEHVLATGVPAAQLTYYQRTYAEIVGKLRKDYDKLARASESHRQQTSAATYFESLTVLDASLTRLEGKQMTQTTDLPAIKEELKAWKQQRAALEQSLENVRRAASVAKRVEALQGNYAKAQENMQALMAYTELPIYKVCVQEWAACTEKLARLQRCPITTAEEIAAVEQAMSQWQRELKVIEQGLVLVRAVAAAQECMLTLPQEYANAQAAMQTITVPLVLHPYKAMLQKKLADLGSALQAMQQRELLHQPVVEKLEEEIKAWKESLHEPLQLLIGAVNAVAPLAELADALVNVRKEVTELAAYKDLPAYKQCVAKLAGSEQSLLALQQAQLGSKKDIDAFAKKLEPWKNGLEAILPELHNAIQDHDREQSVHAEYHRLKQEVAESALRLTTAIERLKRLPAKTPNQTEGLAAYLKQIAELETNKEAKRDAKKYQKAAKGIPAACEQALVDQGHVLNDYLLRQQQALQHSQLKKLPEIAENDTRLTAEWHEKYKALQAQQAQLVKMRATALPEGQLEDEQGEWITQVAAYLGVVSDYQRQSEAFDKAAQQLADDARMVLKADSKRKKKAADPVPPVLQAQLAQPPTETLPSLPLATAVVTAPPVDGAAEVIAAPVVVQPATPAPVVVPQKDLATQVGDLYLQLKRQKVMLQSNQNPWLVMLCAAITSQMSALEAQGDVAVKIAAAQAALREACVKSADELLAAVTVTYRAHPSIALLSGYSVTIQELTAKIPSITQDDLANLAKDFITPFKEIAEKVYAFMQGIQATAAAHQQRMPDMAPPPQIPSMPQGYHYPYGQQPVMLGYDPYGHMVYGPPQMGVQGYGYPLLAPMGYQPYPGALYAPTRQTPPLQVPFNLAATPFEPRRTYTGDVQQRRAGGGKGTGLPGNHGPGTAAAL